MQRLHPLIERRSARWWLLTGGLAAIMLFAGTWVATGLMDVILLVSGATSGTLGGWASFERTRIAALPLSIAPRLARTEGLRGPEFAFRGVLGRGRRYAIVSIDVTSGGNTIPVRHHSGVGVGPFQGTFDDPKGSDVSVRVVLDESGQSHEVAMVFDVQSAVDGRFVPLWEPGVGWTSVRDFGTIR